MDDDIDTTYLKKKAAATSAKERYPWRELKKQTVLAALLRNDGATVATARELGVSRQLIWRFKKTLGLG